MQNQRNPGLQGPKVSTVQVYWKTVTYRTVVLYVMLVLGVISATLYLIYPEVSAAQAPEFPNDGQRCNRERGDECEAGKVCNLDGKVQVKKVNSVQWVTADYRMSLDKAT